MNVPNSHPAERSAAPLASLGEPDAPALAVRQAVHERSIARFSRAEWNALAIEPSRDWFYFQALERLALPGFSPVYFGVRCQGRLRAAIGGFLLDGVRRPRPDLIQDQLARVLGRIGRGRNARALVLGSPLNEPCAVALAADANGTERRELLAQMLAAADEFASRHDYGVLAVKDACATAEGLWEWACDARHLKRLRGVIAWPTKTAVTSRSWYRAETPWLDWCYQVIDGAFGFDLRDEELRQLLGPGRHR